MSESWTFHPLVGAVFVFILYNIYEWMGYEDFVAGMLCLLLVVSITIARRSNTEDSDGE